MDKETLLDFVTHPYWPEVERLLAKLIAELEHRAARCEEKHELERGRLLGVERAALVLDEWRTKMKKELRRGTPGA